MYKLHEKREYFPNLPYTIDIDKAEFHNNIYMTTITAPANLPFKCKAIGVGRAGERV